MEDVFTVGGIADLTSQSINFGRGCILAGSNMMLGGHSKLISAMLVGEFFRSPWRGDPRNILMGWRNAGRSTPGFIISPCQSLDW